MKKSNPLVTIPQGSVCIPLNEVINSHIKISHLCRSNSNMENELRRLSAQNDELTAKLAEAEKKLSDTEEELKQEGDRKMYWYDQYMKLVGGSEKGDPNAQAKTI